MASGCGYTCESVMKTRVINSTQTAYFLFVLLLKDITQPIV